MPIVELEKNHRALVGVAAKLYRESPLWPSTSQVKRLVKDTGLTYVGHGQECVVTESENHPNFVVAIHCLGLTASEAKLTYHSQRIMTLLFPHNFPHFIAVFGKHPEKEWSSSSFSYRQEVRGENSGGDGYAGLDKSSVYPFKNVIRTIEELDLPVEFDRYKNNFKLGPDGGVYYLDTSFIFWSDYEEEQTRRILRYMEENQYSKLDVKAVEQSIERIIILTKQFWKPRRK